MQVGQIYTANQCFTTVSDTVSEHSFENRSALAIWWKILCTKISKEMRSVLRVDERTPVSYIGRDGFFPGKVLKFFQAQIYFFRGLTFKFLFQFRSFTLLKGRKANSTIEQQKCKVHEKRDRLLVPKVKLNSQISQRSKIFTLSNWVNFIK